MFAGTSTIAFAYCNAIKLIPYYFLGQINLESLEKAVVMMPVAAVAVFLGVWLVKKLPEKLFFQLVMGLGIVFELETRSAVLLLWV